jgi:hypothetical protein
MERKAFQRFEALKESITITIGDGEILPVEGVGSVFLDVRRQEGNRTIELKNTLYVPRLRHNLLSIERVARTGSTIIFQQEKCVIERDEISLKAHDSRGL